MPDQSSAERCVDDGAAASTPHFRDDGLGAEEGALGIDLHHAVPVFGGRLFHRPDMADGRVVDLDVEFGDYSPRYPNRLGQ